jgi:hypothetical protein
MAMHACLHAERASLAADAPAIPEFAEEGLLSPASRLESVADRSHRTSLAPSARRTWTLAAVLACVALFSGWIAHSVFGPVASSITQNQGTTGSASVVATITGTYNCMWDAASGAIGYGSALVVGQKLELEQGLAKITFEDGTAVILESPATFVVQTPHQVQLHSGRMSAVVPARSRGFRVSTRTLDVFDVGNEYGLVAKQSGAAEVHVFNGLVKAEVIDASGRRLRSLSLNASEAARVHPVSTTVMKFPAEESEFVRSMLPGSGPHDGLLAYESFDYPEGPLAAQNGGFGWAGPWFDIADDIEAGPSSNRVMSGSLAIEGIMPQGNRAAQTSQKNRIRRSLSTSVGGVFDVAGLVENQDGLRLVGRDGQEVYISFIQKVSALGDNFYGVELYRGDGNPNRVLCVGHGVEGTGYGITSNSNVYGPGNFPALGSENTEANLIVIKITFGVDNQDILHVYRNPESLGDESACSADAVLKGNFSFDRISMANFHGDKVHLVDELRVGTHFLAVTGRWGGERSLLLRRITMQTLPRPDTNNLERGQFARRLAADAGYRNSPLLASIFR